MNWERTAAKHSAIKVIDERGEQIFTGTHRVKDALGYVPAGAAQWSLKRTDNTWRTVPPPGASQSDEWAAPPPPAAPQPQPGPIADPMRLALEYGDRQAQLIARAYADAYQVAGRSWAAVVAPLSDALTALSQRVVQLEEHLGELPAPAEPPPPPTPSPLDQLAEGVLTGVVSGAMSATGKG